MTPFSILDDQRLTRLEVTLDRPFANLNYAVVAMTDQPACTASLENRSPEAFTIRIQQHEATEATIQGVCFWIALGDEPSLVEQNPLGPKISTPGYAHPL